VNIIYVLCKQVCFGNGHGYDQQAITFHQIAEFLSLDVELLRVEFPIQKRYCARKYRSVVLKLPAAQTYAFVEKKIQSIQVSLKNY
jgi:hypothetical protein